MGNSKDEYDFIYGNGDDSGIDYADVDENEDEQDVIDRLKEELGRGTCPKCKGLTMVPDEGGYCYYCLNCGYAEQTEAYLRHVAGYRVKTIDEAESSRYD